jgi:hypothetical protein
VGKEYSPLSSSLCNFLHSPVDNTPTGSKGISRLDHATKIIDALQVKYNAAGI